MTRPSHSSLGLVCKSRSRQARLKTGQLNRSVDVKASLTSPKERNLSAKTTLGTGAVPEYLRRSSEVGHYSTTAMAKRNGTTTHQQPSKASPVDVEQLLLRVCSGKDFKN